MLTRQEIERDVPDTVTAKFDLGVLRKSDWGEQMVIDKLSRCARIIVRPPFHETKI